MLIFGKKLAALLPFFSDFAIKISLMKNKI